MSRDYHNNIISETETVKQAMQLLNSMSNRNNLTLFVADKDRRIVGTLTDGDIRRGLVEGKSIDDAISKFMHKNFRALKRNQYSLDDIDKLRELEIFLIPLLDEDNRIIKIVDLSEKRSILPLDVFMLAGGEGRRLRPLTNDIPKPLLIVGNKPIIEHNLDRMESYGIDSVFLSVNYKADQLSNHFKDKKYKELELKFIREKSPMGTLGSITLIEKFTNDCVLIMNSDLLTNIDLEDFYRTFVSSGADMIVAGVPYKVEVPYAVMEVNGEEVVSFREKPTYTYYSNAGIYILRKDLIKLIPEGGFYNATDLMEKLISEKLKLVYYPILGYWLDIGQHEDYKKAQEDIKHIKL